MTYTDQNELPFSIRIREIVIATAAAFAVYFAIFGIGFNSDSNNVIAATAKSDRLPLAGETKCAGQTWGQWDRSCLTALANRTDLRLVGSHTTEIRDPEQRVSILLSEPARN